MTWVGQTQVEAKTAQQIRRRMSFAAAAAEAQAQDFEKIRRMLKDSVVEEKDEQSVQKEECEVKEPEADTMMTVEEIEKVEADAEQLALKTEAVPQPIQTQAVYARSSRMMSRNAAANPGASLYKPVW